MGSEYPKGARRCAGARPFGRGATGYHCTAAIELGWLQSGLESGTLASGERECDDTQSRWSGNLVRQPEPSLGCGVTPIPEFLKAADAGLPRMADCPPSETSITSEWRQRLSPSVALAWRAFDRASALPSRVTPAVPILFFGDLDAYLTSPLRVLTVGLNPSLHEFPADEPFRRFPLAGNSGDGEPGRYLDAMSAYFHTDPYSSWFHAFEQVLNGAGSSYYTGEVASTALHTDICSPVATDPTWSKLPRVDRAALEGDGGHALANVA